MCFICGDFGLSYASGSPAAATSPQAAVGAAVPVVRDYTALVGLNGGSGWNGQDGTSAGTPVIVTYSFETSAYSYLAGQGLSAQFIASFEALNAAQKTLARDALALWDAAAGISFVEVPAGQGDIRFAKYNFDFNPAYSDAAGYAYYANVGYVASSGYSYSEPEGGDVYLNTQEAPSLALVQLYSHELGHTLGFKHPFDDSPLLADDLDNTSQTVMSYSGPWGSTLGPLDLAAARFRYGTTDHSNTSSWSWNAATYLLTQVGTGGADRILGVSVRDSLSGGVGNDTLVGLGGNDTISGDVGLDVIFGGEGADRLSGGIGEDSLYGDEGNDSIFGGAGNDSLVGDDGNDTLFGDDGADTVVGGSGFDTLSYANATIAVVFDGSVQTNNAGAALGDRMIYGLDIEQVVGSSLADTIRLGVYVANANGGAGNDTIYGDNYYSTSDTLDGGAGVDRLTGYLGSDTYFVDNVGDVVIDSGGITDVVVASVSYTLVAGQAIEVLRTINPAATTLIDLVGNEFVQTLTGNAGNNQLNGAGGADFMYGFGGNDVYHVDDGRDRIFESAGGGTDTVRSRSTTFILGAGQSIESITTEASSGTVTRNLYGNEVGQALFGNNGSNILDGRLGNDQLVGYGGRDYFTFSTALGTANVDRVVDFTHGVDIIRLDNAVFTAVGANGALAAAALHTGTGAHSDTDRIIYNSADGSLSYDSDGLGGVAAVRFAILATGLTLTASDFQIL